MWFGLRAVQADDASQEYKLKAAFMVNFARFTTWPDGTFPSDTAPIIIATVGTDPFAGALEQSAAGKKVGARPLEVRHIESVDQIKDCQMLFVCQSDKQTMERVLQRLKDAHVMTIGDDENFTANGGAIRFFTADNKMRFEINKDATDKARLTISSRLMALAKIFGK